MSLSIVQIVPKAGMSYVVTENGAADVKVPYQVVLSEPLGAQSLITAFTSLDGDIPSIGTEHPARPGYYVARYDVKQPTGIAKASLDVDVVYSPRSYVTEGGGGGEPGTECNIEQWGWDDGTAERELVQAVDGTQVLNSAKDPFDSVPTVSTPSPTFTKVVRFGERKSGWFGYNCKVNSASMTIGGVTFPARTLLCSICESIDPQAEKWPYRYQVRLRYRSNLATIGTSTAEECGWDAVVTDAGMREIDSTTGKLKLIQTVSAETGVLATVTSPELLDGNGHAITRYNGQLNQPPYNFKFKAYEEVSFPDWFTSEPPLAITPTPATEESNTEE